MRDVKDAQKVKHTGLRDPLDKAMGGRGGVKNDA